MSLFIVFRNMKGIFITMKKVLGLVLELNPAHNGHQYFIQEAKKKVNPDITIAIFSTNFSMRGDISVVDKFTKTRLALEMGIDIILELPFTTAINSADYFCFHAIHSLIEMGMTDLAFGVELNNLDKLIQMKELIQSNLFQEHVKHFLNNGLSYSASSYKAIQKLTDDEEIKTWFTHPNITLGIQYLTSLEKLHANINITLIQRIGNQYYDEIATSRLASATSIRNMLLTGEDISSYTPPFQTNIDYLNQKTAYDKLFMLLKYHLITITKDDLEKIHGISEGIENRIINIIDQSKDYFEFVKNVQTRRYTQNKIRRLLLHILCNSPGMKELPEYAYLRVLGFNFWGEKYINTLKKTVKNNIITSFKNMKHPFCKSEMIATKLYGLLINQDEFYLNEFKIPIKQGEKL